MHYYGGHKFEADLT